MNFYPLEMLYNFNVCLRTFPLNNCSVVHAVILLKDSDKAGSCMSSFGKGVASLECVRFAFDRRSLVNIKVSL